MRRRARQGGLSLAFVVLMGCHAAPRPAPVPVQGPAKDRAALAGTWTGRYWSKGVRGVSNFLLLREAPTTSTLKQSIREALARQAAIDAGQVAVEVSGSRVTLRGTVRSMAERRDAASAAWNAPGVTRVENEITVSPFVPAAL